MSREDDIQTVCKHIIDDYYNVHDDAWVAIVTLVSSCNYCYSNSTQGIDPKTINHEPDCAYLIAVDLSTNGGLQ